MRITLTSVTCLQSPVLWPHSLTIVGEKSYLPFMVCYFVLNVNVVRNCFYVCFFFIITVLLLSLLSSFLSFRCQVYREGWMWTSLPLDFPSSGALEWTSTWYVTLSKAPKQNCVISGINLYTEWHKFHGPLGVISRFRQDYCWQQCRYSSVCAVADEALHIKKNGKLP